MVLHSYGPVAATARPAAKAEKGHNETVSRAAPPGRADKSRDLPPASLLPPLVLRSERSASTAPPPPMLGASGGIATGRRAGRAQVTALVLSLRRRAEADAQEQLRRLRGQLELARQAETQAERMLEQAEHERQRLSSALASAPARLPDAPEPPRRLAATPAQELASQCAHLLRQRQFVQQRQRQLAAAAAEVHTLLHRQAELHAALRLALARREAAELHQTEERREQKRAKAQRQRTLRLTKSPRR